MRPPLDALADTRWSIEDYARLMGIEPHPGQIRFWEALIRRDKTAWRAAYLTLAVSAGNRAGKTLALAVAILHHCHHRIGIRPPDLHNEKDVDAYIKAPFHWYHFGILQEVGELVFNDMKAIVEGTHEAQKRLGNPFVEAMGVPFAAFDTKERGEYRWVRFDAIFGGAEVHFRTTSEKALGSLGKAMHGLSFDECGFEPNLSFIVNEVMHLRRMSTGGPMILISTPSEGFTQFSDEWKRGDPTDPEREPDHISLRMSTRDNVGYGIDKDMFDRLLAGVPPHLIPQNIDGYFIEGRNAFFDHASVDNAFVKDLPEHAEAITGHTYVHGVDPALTHDGTWSIVVDVSEGKATGVSVARLKGRQTMGKVIAMVEKSHFEYENGSSTCITGLDTTGFGGKVFRDALSSIYPIHNVEFGGTKARKMKLLMDLKGLLDSGRLRFPRYGAWLDLRRQLMGYRLDKESSLETDAVMALAVATKLLVRGGIDAKTTHAPFDFMSGGMNNEHTIDEDRTEGEVPEGLTRRRPSALLKHPRLRKAMTISRMGA